jgi:hypothetical protein
MDSIKLWARNGEAVRQALELGEIAHIETASEELTDEFLVFAIESGLLTHIPHPSDGDPRHFLAAFFARTTNPPSGMVSSHERRYTKHLCPWRVVWVSCSRLSKRTTSHICPL